MTNKQLRQILDSIHTELTMLSKFVDKDDGSPADGTGSHVYSSNELLCYAIGDLDDIIDRLADQEVIDDERT